MKSSIRIENCHFLHTLQKLQIALQFSLYIKLPEGDTQHTKQHSSIYKSIKCGGWFSSFATPISIAIHCEPCTLHMWRRVAALAAAQHIGHRKYKTKTKNNEWKWPRVNVSYLNWFLASTQFAKCRLCAHGACKHNNKTKMRCIPMWNGFDFEMQFMIDGDHFNGFADSRNWRCGSRKTTWFSMGNWPFLLICLLYAICIAMHTIDRA